MNALDVLCAQLLRDLFAIAKFLFTSLGRCVGVFSQCIVSHQGTTLQRPLLRAFYTIYAHSPQGDNAAAIAEFALPECSCIGECYGQTHECN